MSGGRGMRTWTLVVRPFKKKSLLIEVALLLHYKYNLYLHYFFRPLCSQAKKSRPPVSTVSSFIYSRI